MSNLDKWIEAVLCVADANGMDDRQEIDTWPWDVKARYPLLTVGDIREWQSSRQALEGSPEPIAHLTWHQGMVAVDDYVEYLELSESSKLSCDGTPAFPVYTHPARQAVSVPFVCGGEP